MNIAPAIAAALLLAVAPQAALAMDDADQNCGRVSSFDMAPRNRQVYPVRVLAIDGTQPGPSTSDVFRVAPGMHVVRLAELIDVEEFNSVELRRRNIGDVARAEISFEVEPGYTYFVGAQSFLRSDDDAIAVQRGREYWAPVVYQRIFENCR